MLNPQKVIALSLPTLVLFCGLSWRWFREATNRQEVFGSADTYLDVRFFKAGNESRVPFKGTLVTETGEEKISGMRVLAGHEMQYVFETHDGKFTGHLARSAKGCEPTLIYQIEKNGKKTPAKKLKAGFCL